MTHFNLLFHVMRGFNRSNSSEALIINNHKLTATQLAHLRNNYGVDLNPGNYWYDTQSGLFGRQGEPFLGVFQPGHEFGTLATDASSGKSGVFINHRELQRHEARQLARLFCYHKSIPARYWLDASGDMGDEGYPFVAGNIYLAIAIAQKYQTSSVHNFWTQRLSGNYNYCSRIAS